MLLTTFLFAFFPTFIVAPTAGDAVPLIESRNGNGSRIVLAAEATPLVGSRQEKSGWRVFIPQDQVSTESVRNARGDVMTLRRAGDAQEAAPLSDAVWWRIYR